MPESKQNEYAPDVWGASDIGGLEDITVPSGQRCQVKRPGVEGLMIGGVLASVDTLTAMVEVKHVKRAKAAQRGKRYDPEAEQAKALAEMSKDPEKLKTAIEMINQVTCFIVVQPHLEPVPEDGEREKGVIYVDQVDLNDKLFLFQYAVGGTRDLERFRTEFDKTVGNVESQQAVESPS